MTPRLHYRDDQVTLWCGDALEALREMPDESVDAVVTDPPYGLEFMGKEWDSFKPSAAQIRTRSDERTNPTAGKSVTSTPEAYVAGRPFQAWCHAWTTECLRVLKPGGHLLAFGGTRTWHRLVCAIEDVGFEIRDSITWMYATGFPKSLDVSKAIDKAAGVEREVLGESPHARNRQASSYQADGTLHGYIGRPEGRRLVTAATTDNARQWAGWGTALKPAHEPICVARKPLNGTVAANVLAYGTGALNVDGCRVGAGEPDGRTRERDGETSAATRYGSGAEFSMPPGPRGGSADGRWPTNVILSHAGSDEVGDLCADGCVPGCPVAELDKQSGTLTSGVLAPHHNAKASTNASLSGPNQEGRIKGTFGGDSGGASRFFPAFRYEAKAHSSERPRVDGVAHPTVKPVDLMAWLVRLVTSPDAVVLDPFAGSGTTGEACIVEGRRAVLIERDPNYLPLVVTRLTKPLQQALI